MIKKLVFICILLCASVKMTAQETRFGLTAGYLNVDVKASFEGISASASESGFYVGAFADFALNESFHLQTGLNYGQIEDSGILFVPIMAKYYIANSGFYLQGGPQITYLLEDSEGEFNNLGLDLGFGAGYDITNNIFVEARYAFEITNRLTDESRDFFGSDVNSKINTLMVGVGYKF